MRSFHFWKKSYNLVPTHFQHNNKKNGVQIWQRQQLTIVAKLNIIHFNISVFVFHIHRKNEVKNKERSLVVDMKGKKRNKCNKLVGRALLSTHTCHLLILNMFLVLFFFYYHLFLCAWTLNHSVKYASVITSHTLHHHALLCSISLCCLSSFNFFVKLSVLS